MNITYHCNLKGNKQKLDFLELQYKYSQVVARYYLIKLRKSKDYRRSWFTQNIYRKVRNKYPFIYSKLLIHIRDKVLSSVKTKKLFKVKGFRIPLIFDYQNFNIEFKEGYYNAWIRFCKKNYPLEGLRTIDKIKNVRIKEIQIKKIDNKWRIYFVCEVPIQNKVKGNLQLGCDINLTNISLSNNKRYNLKRFIHKKKEYRKEKQRIKIVNYTKTYIHTLTSNLVKYIVELGGSQIILENLTNLRKSSSRKEGTSKGKNLNYLLNNSFPYKMFQEFLTYKCKKVGIEVKLINPKDTSKTCSKCNSLNIQRPKQSLIICKDCRLKINADFNGAKNILRFSLQDGLLNHSNQSELLKQTDKPMTLVVSR